MIRTITDALAHKRSNLAEKEKGFTLIELLVVVIIIGILAAIAIPVYLGVQGNAKDSAVKSDVSNAKTAVVAYQTDKNGVYPTDLTAANLPASYGYSAPSSGDSNYTGGDIPAITFATAPETSFAICAKSTTGKTFGASDKTGVAEGTCSGGVFTKKAATP